MATAMPRFTTRAASKSVQQRPKSRCLYAPSEHVNSNPSTKTTCPLPLSTQSGATSPQGSDSSVQQGGAASDAERAAVATTSRNHYAREFLTH